MNDRETFRKNLNYYLAAQGKLQKDLAEYVGAKTTTVSGWTRGVSYPRADAMEKIAMFFGIPTSKLISDGDTINERLQTGLEQLTTLEARIISGGIDKMPQAKREEALRILQAIFTEYFDEEGKFKK